MIKISINVLTLLRDFTVKELDENNLKDNLTKAILQKFSIRWKHLKCAPRALTFYTNCCNGQTPGGVGRVDLQL